MLQSLSLKSPVRIFFAVSNKNFVRILGGKVTDLVRGNDGVNWEDIESPFIEDIVIPKDEVNEIIARLKEYSAALF